MSLNDLIYNKETGHNARAMFYSITGGGTDNITVIGSAYGEVLFQLGPLVIDDEDSSTSNEGKKIALIVGLTVGLFFLVGGAIALW